MGIDLLFVKTGTAVFYQNTDAFSSLFRLQPDCAVIAIFADAVFYGIFNQRLDGEWWNLKLCHGDIFFKYQCIAKPGILYKDNFRYVPVLFQKESGPCNP